MIEELISSPVANVSGTITNSIDKFMIFTTTETNYTFTIPSGGVVCDILMIGGGGGGSLGGGGAGACIVAINQTLPAGSCVVNVGVGAEGGNNSAINGGDSFITVEGKDRYRAKGGGKGGYNDQPPLGGCGGGSGLNPSTLIGGRAVTRNVVNGSTATIGPSITSTYAVFGTNGGTVTGSTNDGFGGGGGIGDVGGNFNQGLVSGLGGNGLYQATINSQIYNFRTYFANNTTFGVQDGTTTNYYIGGGGGGSSYHKVGSTAGSGGKGGGGAGGDVKIQSLAVAGVANTGSGGGGNDPQIVNPFASGGSGIVIIRYREFPSPIPETEAIYKTELAPLRLP